MTKAPNIISSVVSRWSKMPTKSTVLLYEPEGKSNIEIAKYLKDKKGFICGTYKKFQAWCYKNLKNKYDIIIAPCVFSEHSTKQQALFDNICELLNPNGELYIHTTEDRDLEGMDYNGAEYKTYTKDGQRSYVFKNVNVKNVSYDTNNQEAIMNTKMRLTEDEKKLICKKFAQGKKINTICEETKRSEATVRRILLKSGQLNIGIRSHSEEDILELIKMYKSGLSVTEILKHPLVNIRSRTTLIRILRDDGCYKKVLTKNPVPINKTFDDMDEFLEEQNKVLLNKYPMPPEIIEKVLKDYYEGTYIPELKRKDAIAKIKDIMKNAGLTSEEILSLI